MFARAPPRLRRREVQKAGVHRPLELPGAFAMKEDVGNMGIDTLGPAGAERSGCGEKGNDIFRTRRIASCGRPCTGSGFVPVYHRRRIRSVVKPQAGHIRIRDGTGRSGLCPPSGAMRVSAFSPS